jgi:hypothetical protein
MQIRLLLALVGSGIGFVVPTVAQQKETLNPQIVEQLNASGINLTKHSKTAMPPL